MMTQHPSSPKVSTPAREEILRGALPPPMKVPSWPPPAAAASLGDSLTHYYSLDLSQQADETLPLFQSFLSEGRDAKLAEVQLHYEIAESFARRGRLRLARDSYEQALKHLDAFPENEHASTRAGLLNNLALLLRRMELFDDSELFYIKAIDILERKKPEPTLQIAMVYNNLGQLYQSTSHWREAAKLHQRALDLLKDSQDHAALRFEIYANRGKALLAEGRYKEAANDLNSALKVNMDAPGLVNRAHVGIAICQALALLKCGRWEESEASARIALDIYGQLSKAPSNDLAAIHNLLGYILVARQLLPEAIEHYRASLSALTSIMVPDAFEVADAHFNLAMVFAANGEGEESADHLGLAATLVDQLGASTRERDEHFRHVFFEWIEKGKSLKAADLSSLLLLKHATAN